LIPQHLSFGGGVSQSVINPIVLLLVLLAGVLILVWPRRKALAAFISGAILIPIDQVLVIGGVHFPMLRVLALFGIVRLIREKTSAKRKIFSGGINRIDLAVILLAIFIAIAGVVLFKEWGAAVYQIGNIYTVFGVYFLLRFLIRDREDIVCLVRTLACVAAFVAVVMAWEFVTGHNPYALLGGARAASYATLLQRDDRFRALGCFGHPILAGTFGAILIPLFVLLWSEAKKYRVLAAVGIVSATVITLTSNSSTPLLAYAGGILALFMWPLRHWMRAIRWGIVVTLVGLHAVMKAPVWHLISRIDVSGGSSSYHRFMLIDQCIRHFGDWWFVGVKSTAEWGWDMWDTANQYVSICDSSGLLPFILFVAIIAYGFKYLGKARKTAADRMTRFFMWALGSALFATAVAFVGISFWDQTQVVWYALLAAISAAAVMRPEAACKSRDVVPPAATNWAEHFAEPAASLDDDNFATDSPQHSAHERFFAF
jgi:hypothetical protein